MIDDDALDLAAECYVALRARGYLKEFPTFESFLLRAIRPSVPAPERSPRPLAGLAITLSAELPPAN